MILKLREGSFPLLFSTAHCSAAVSPQAGCHQQQWPGAQSVITPWWLITILHSLHSDTATSKQWTADNTAFQQIHSNSTRPDYLGFAGLLKWLLEVLKSTSSQIPQSQVTKTGSIIAPIKLQHSRWQFSANASTHDNHTNMFPGAGLSPLSPPPSSKTSKLSWCCGVAVECWQ